MDSMLNRTLGNRYEILEKIGDGGMALVYKGRDNLLNRFVAVKVLRPEFAADQDFVAKFQKEAQSSAGLSHPSIVNIYDVGMEETLHFIVMEYVSGSTLKQYIKDKGTKMGEFEMISIAKQIAEALDMAHRNHIIHRDIKPHNILLNESARVKVADFGIARAITSSTITNTAEIMGSVHYTSPEQARGGFVDERSDIYSLGVVMYEMAAGRVPYDGDSPVTIALRHMKDDLILPSGYNKDLSYGLEDIISKALQKSPANRFQNVGELISDLNRLIMDPDMEFNYVYSDESAPTMVMPKVDGSESLDDKIMDHTLEIPSFLGQSKGAPSSSEKTIGRESRDRKGSNASKRNKLKNKKSGAPTDKRSIIVSAVAGVTLSILLFALVFNMIFGNWSLPSLGGKQVQVPDVEKINITVATERLKAAGFKVATPTEQASDEVMTDFVISQEPKVGTKAKEGSTIQLIVSTGSDQPKVPDVKGKVLEDAKKILINAGLQAGTVEFVESTEPSGVVVEQSPAADALANSDKTVNLKLSEGRNAASIIMPNLVGKNINEVRTLLAPLKLTVGNITQNFSNDYTENTIILQSVKNGTKVAENTAIDVVVSKGKDPSGTTATGTPGTTGTPSGTDTTMSTKLYVIKLTFAEERATVKVVKVQNGVEEVVYDKEHAKSEGSIKVPVQGKGQATVIVYFNGTQVFSKVENFN